MAISAGPEWVTSWPGQGKFTVEEDRKVLQELTGELLATKCSNLLRSGQSHWRFYQALQPKARGHAEFLNEDLDHFLDRYSLLDARSVVEGMTPLMLASLEGNISVMRELLKSKAQVDERISWRLPEAHIHGTVVTALSLASSLSSKEAVLALLDARASLDLPSGLSGAGVVVQAAYFGNSSVLAALIERRGDMNYPTTLGGNALLAAAGASNVDCTRILLEQRADPNFMNYIGSTALSFSCLFNTDAGHAELLLQARADPNLRGLAKNCLWATVCWACQKKIQMGNATSIHWNIALSNGGTPLHVAALNGSLQAVVYMCMCSRFDVHALVWRCRQIAMLVMVHAQHGLFRVLRRQIAMLLMEHDADVEATWGDNLLLWWQLAPSVRQLLSARAKPRLTPLDLAKNHDHQDNS